MFGKTSKFAEERMKLYAESLTNSKAALASTKPPTPDIKLSVKDLSTSYKSGSRNKRTDWDW